MINPTSHCRGIDWDDTKSPLTNPNIDYPTGSSLRVHFYHLNSRSPWWLRWFWRPKPLYGHCSVEWWLYVHNMTLREDAGFHYASEWHAENPPDLTMETSFNVSFDDAKRLVRQFDGEKVSRWRVFLWWSGLSRKHVPMSCTYLVASWIDPTWVRSQDEGHMFQPRVGTPDELFHTLRGMSNVR